MHHYTYLITNLQPENTQKYYIGVRSSEQKPEEDLYMGSSGYLQEDIDSIGCDSFEKIVISEWETRELAEKHEVRLHEEYNVKSNPLFYNRANALDNGWSVYRNEDAAQKQSETMQNPNWKATIGKERVRKQLKTKSDPVWKLTVDRERVEKQLKTKSSPDWQETVGKETSRKHSETVQDPLWKRTVGKKKREKEVATKNSKEWQETVLVEAKRKIKETRSSKEWLEANTYTCEHCHKTMVGKTNYIRWHGNKCKEKK